MLIDTKIKSLEIISLHESFDVTIHFTKGLNIIYGKNGKGKTTILHILANFLELDFQRFKHLSFSSIKIRTYGKTLFHITKTSSSDITLKVDHPSFSLSKSITELTEDDLTQLRALVGHRSTYLPAFRSVLERTSDFRYASGYGRSSESDAELSIIRQSESEALREVQSRSETPRAIMEEADRTASKTYQCRQWFGAFVPVIRYPSIIDVTEGLTSEWRNAQFETSRREQSMYENVFVSVFRTIVGLDKTPKESTSSNLVLNDIAHLLEEDAFSIKQDSSSIYDQLLEAVNYNKQSTHDIVEIENAVLNLYKNMLFSRKEERKRAFQKSRDFEESVNTFLDKKKLKIGAVGEGVRRSLVSVSTEGQRSYGLTALSSGEKQILTMLYSASRSKFDGGLFLIDEPELSLHIDWQRSILRELMSLAQNRQIIVCTHSPEVGADHIDATQDFEPQITKSAPQSNLFSIDDSES